MEKTLKSARFLLKNNRSSGVVVYATRQMLQKLSETGINIADGTFKACPEQFEQIYVNFGVIDEGKHNYRRLFEIIKQKIGKISAVLIETLGKLSRFSSQVLFRQMEFPNAVHCGCYSYFTHAIFRRVQNSGL